MAQQHPMAQQQSPMAGTHLPTDEAIRRAFAAANDGAYARGFHDGRDAGRTATRAALRAARRAAFRRGVRVALQRMTAKGATCNDKN